MKPHSYDQSIPPNKYNPLSWIHPDAVIGDNCWIGAFVYIGGNVEIGDNVSISNGVQIFDHDNSWHRASEGCVPVLCRRVYIDSFTQIGANSVIVPGRDEIHIGDHCIIGALSLVKNDIPAYSMAVGVPAKIVRHINDDVVKEKMRP